ncbi:MAG: ankyrin repeat domain-containing protein [Pseudomonadota bacterium]
MGVDSVLQRAALTTGLLSLFTAPSYAETNAWPQTPWRPHLIYAAEGEETRCADFKQRVISDFYRDHPDRDSADALNLFNDIPGVGLGTYLELQDTEAPQEPSSVRNANYADRLAGVYIADFTGNGAEELVVSRRSGGDNIRDYQYYTSLAAWTRSDLNEFGDRLRAVSRDEHNLRATGEIWRDEFAPRYFSGQFKPAGGGTDPAPSQRARMALRNAYPLNAFTILTHRGQAFADVATPRFFHTERVLVSFAPDMTPKGVCVVAAQPSMQAHIANWLGAGAFKEVLTATDHVTGSRGCHGGTSKPHYYMSIRRDSFLEQTLLRPWTYFADIPESDPQHRLKQALFAAEENDAAFNHYQYYWSLQGAFNRRAYAVLDEQSERAASELIDYYVSQFPIAIEDASRLAVGVIEKLRGDSSARGDYYFSWRNAPEALERIYHGDADAADFIALARAGNEDDTGALDDALRLAANAGASNGILTALLADGAAVDSGNESALMGAVDLDRTRRFLLARDADPNRPNFFGKTPIMMAAHMNALLAVRDLLAAGAAANETTFADLADGERRNGRDPRDGRACEYKIHFKERTALMYAAENASLDVIEVLLDAGADARAEDSGGRGVFDYLSRNLVLNSEETEAAKALLIAAGATK